MLVKTAYFSRLAKENMMKQTVFLSKFSNLEDLIKYCEKYRTRIDQNGTFLHAPSF